MLRPLGHIFSWEKNVQGNYKSIDLISKACKVLEPILKERIEGMKVNGKWDKSNLSLTKVDHAELTLYLSFFL